MTNQDTQKQRAAQKAVELIEDGMVIGLGSGSTMYWMLEALGEKVREGMQVKGIPSSIKTERWAHNFGIPLTDFSNVQKLDIAIDGADEIDPHFNLIKGGGGSLLREKIVDAAAEQFVVVADERKLVNQLGQFPLPVEVVQFGWELTKSRIESLGCEAVLRTADDDTFVTNNGNYILDCHFKKIEKPYELHDQLKAMLGVVETGLFLDMTDCVIIGKEDTVDVLRAT